MGGTGGNCDVKSKCSDWVGEGGGGLADIGFEGKANICRAVFLVGGIEEALGFNVGGVFGVSPVHYRGHG